ncbi:calcium-activated chloride channel regulator 4A-like [Apostichopus japonicus]|uniref:calcium-activated chloride channel regulator 4A-like n=1 Tax=Stichopus japonicus TaxID=307972 RepID=UPI003AB72666
MTSSFLLNKKRLSPVMGDYGRLLVHEWGHYRWGLFNEYPDHVTDEDRAQDFYHTAMNQRWEPVSCTSDWRITPLKYTGGKPTHRLCEVNQGAYEEGCLAVPSKGQYSS